MSELTADCDALKEKIRKLEKENEVLRRSEAMLRINLTSAEQNSRQQVGVKMELLQILSTTAQHLGVSEAGTNQEVSFRIWSAINALRKRDSGPLLEVAEAVGADTEGTSSNVADSILVQFSKAKEEAIRGFEELMKTYDVDGIPALNTYIEHQLDTVTSLKEEIDVLNADHQAAIEGRDKELNERSGEIKMYSKQYKELDQAAKKALASAGLTGIPELYTVQQTVLDALERLSEAALNDTVDSKLKELEQICYSAESRSGMLCREENPWARIKWALESMSERIRQLGHSVPAELNEALNQTLHTLGLTNVVGPCDTQLRAALSILEAIREKAQGDQGDLKRIQSRTQGILGNMYALPLMTASDPVRATLHYLDVLEKKAQMGQEIKAAYLKLKELL